jgi:V8-like Glu-specific endopeptidase
MHPKVKLLQMQFGSVQELIGMSGSPIFNNKEKVVGMFFAS